MQKLDCASQAVLFCPAKVNLMLALTGRQERDGLHTLLSVMAPVDFGDYLWLEARAINGADTLACSQAEIDTGPENLVLRAATAFRQAVDLPCSLHFYLEKNIPIGAGLGGGSSDGAGALRLLNTTAGCPLSKDELCALAAQIGADCPFFIEPRPALASGYGEAIQSLAQEQARAISGQRVLLFKPHFSISTAWAYGRLQADHWQGRSAAEARLKKWGEQPEQLDRLFVNDLEQPVFDKYLALPLLLETLRERFGLACQMTGSGSACFAWVDDQAPIDAIRSTIQEAWGADTWLLETRFS